jgi:hypothetical protein
LNELEMNWRKLEKQVELEGPAVLQFSSSPVPLTGGTGVEKSGPG